MIRRGPGDDPRCTCYTPSNVYHWCPVHYLAETWVDTPDDSPAYQDAYKWERVEVHITTDTA